MEKAGERSQRKSKPTAIGSTSKGKPSAPPKQPSEDPMQWRQKLYQGVISVLSANIPEELSGQLKKVQSSMVDQPTITSLAESLQYREQLLQMMSQLPNHIRVKARHALVKDDEEIAGFIRRILSSKSKIIDVLDLDGDDAKQFMKLLKIVRDQRRGDPDVRRKINNLLDRLRSINILPPALALDGVGFHHRLAGHPGMYSDVYQLEYRGEQVALKRLHSFPSNRHRNDSSEVLRKFGPVWQGLDHPNILPFFGVDADEYPHMIGLVSPWMQHGTVLQFLEKKNIQNVSVEQLILQLAQGIEYLHSQDIVHGSLKGSNVLIDHDGHVRLSDFGLFEIVERIEVTSTIADMGSVRWQAPELLKVPKFTPNSRTRAMDTYSFACVCLEIYTGHHPYHIIPTASAAIDEVIKGNRPPRPNSDSRLPMPDDMWQVVENCWKQEPEDRPTFKEVVEALKHDTPE